MHVLSSVASVRNVSIRASLSPQDKLFSHSLSLYPRKVSPAATATTHRRAFGDHREVDTTTSSSSSNAVVGYCVNSSIAASGSVVMLVLVFSQAHATGEDSENALTGRGVGYGDPNLKKR
jgi:hypothetical protein